MSEPLVVGRVIIPAGDLAWSAVRASGPGGQNVNKVASKVVLRFDLAGTTALGEGVKAKLRGLAGSKLDRDGAIVISSQKSRGQASNLEDARDKLAQMIRRALEPEIPRTATRPSRASKRRRLEEKKKRSEKKDARRRPASA